MNREGRMFPGVLVTALTAFAVACGDDPMPPEPPAAPTGVTATANTTDVTVTWSGQGDTYIVQRQPAGGSFAQMAADLTATTHTDSSLAVGVYAYRVVAVTDGMESEPSDPALVTVVEKDPCQPLTGTISGVRRLNADSV